MKFYSVNYHVLIRFDVNMQVT